MKVWTSSVGERFGPIADVAAFATCAGAAGAPVAGGAGRPRNVLSGAALGRFDDEFVVDHRPVPEGPRSGPGGLSGSGDAVAAATCTERGGSLCLQDGRYEVSANWRAGEQAGAAGGIPRTSDTGMFWFFSRDNVELVVKVLDGCSLNGHRWVLMGGLTDVGVEVIVRDTESDAAVKAYASTEGAPFATKFDVTAFPCVDR